MQTVHSHPTLKGHEPPFSTATAMMDIASHRKCSGLDYSSFAERLFLLQDIWSLIIYFYNLISLTWDMDARRTYHLSSCQNHHAFLL